ncbi:MAG: MFS transporter [Acidimicrobiales bacterium]
MTDLPASPSTESPSTEAVDRHAWLSLSITTLVAFLVVVDVSVVNVAFPSIRADLGASETSLSWIISGYNITVAAFLLIGGRLADSLGRKRVFLPGVVGFLAGSLLSGLAPTAWLLVAARVVQAIGGALLMPSSLAVTLPEFPLSRRATAIGVWGAMGSLGAAFGPSFGSLLIGLGSWRYIFLINVPICVLVVVAGHRVLRESRNPAAAGRPDLAAVPIGAAAVALVMFAIVQSESWGLGDTRVLALAVVGVGLVGLLIRRSRRHPEPLLDLSLFRQRSFAVVNAAGALYSMAFTSGFLLNSLLLQTYWAQSVGRAGLALTPAPLLATAVSLPAGRWADRYGHRWVTGLGAALCASSFLLLLVTVGASPQVWSLFVPISLLYGLGTGLSIASWFSAAVSDVEPARFGVANATLRTVQQVFYAVGVSVVIALVAAQRDAAPLTGFRHAWVWVLVMFTASAVVVTAFFPAGSSSTRRAQRG